MTNSSKAKGDRAELEVQQILRDLLGVPARRALGAGRLDDVGDIDGVPFTVIQVANWRDVAAAVREKPLEAERQRKRPVARVDGGLPLGAAFAATWLRIKSSTTPVTETAYPNWRVVLTAEQYATYWLEAM